MQLVVKAVFLFTKIMFPLTLRFSDSPWWRSPRNPEGRARPPRSPPRRPSIPSGWPRWSRAQPLPTVVSREVEVCSAQDRLRPRDPKCLPHFPRPWKRSRFKRLEDTLSKRGYYDFCSQGANNYCKNFTICEIAVQCLLIVARWPEKYIGLVLGRPLKLFFPTHESEGCYQSKVGATQGCRCT